MFLKGFKEFINESEASVTYQDLKLLLELGISHDITDEVNNLIDQGKMTREEILDWVTPICDKYGIQDWSISEDGRVDVNKDVDLEDLELTRLPLRFGKVTGTFWCASNQLTTLKGSPKEVSGGFYCDENQLTTLEGAPEKVGGHFYCSINQLTTLDGAPSWVGGNFWCNNNQLSTLEGAPEKVGGNFYCSDNQLTTLKGAPEKIGRDFFCSSNQLTTLEGAPKYVDGNFWCNDNRLTTLNGGPEKVGGAFGCSSNQLTTLEGAPQKVGENFYCNYNQLTTLKGSPKEVGADFYCKNNQLTSLDGIGEVKGEIITDFKNNESKLFENISIDLDDSNGLKFATPLSKRKLTIEKNTRYIKNGKALNSIITIKTDTTSHNYQVYVTGRPFNIESIQPDKNNMVKITYYTGKKSGQNWETKSITKSLSALSDYLPELISGKNINPMFIPFKLVRV